MKAKITITLLLSVLCVGLLTLTACSEDPNRTADYNEAHEAEEVGETTEQSEATDAPVNNETEPLETPDYNPLFSCNDCGVEENWPGQCNCWRIKVFNDAQGEQGSRTLINVYTFTNETADMLDVFLEHNPNFSNDYFIRLVYNCVPAHHRAKIALELSSTEHSIDLFVSDIDYAMEFADHSGTATLAELGIEIDESEYYKYTLDLMRKPRGLMGLAHNASPGVMYYRADVAEKALGITSEAEMQALVNNWDDFLTASQKVMEWARREQNNFKMIAGVDELKRNFLHARREPWLVNDILNFDVDMISDFVNVTTALIDMDGVAVKKSAQWDNEWYDGMMDGVFAYFGSTWYLRFTLTPHAFRSTSDGNWGMIPGPQGFYWGGTFWHGSKAAATNADKREGVRQIIEFFCVDNDGIKAWSEVWNDFPAKRTVARRLADEYSENPLFLYKTNPYEVFAEVAEALRAENVTKYDEVFNVVFNDFIDIVFVDGIDIEAALDFMDDSLKERLGGFPVR